jgi:orotidine-5'-phosphate decarboxylase
LTCLWPTDKHLADTFTERTRIVKRPPKPTTPEERLIVALDVSTFDEARALIEDLDGLVSFFKVGMELAFTSGLENVLGLLEGKRVFADLKVPDDIGETIRRTVRFTATRGVRFLTLSHSVGQATVRAAVEGRAPNGELPELLFVPFLSSQDRGDYAAISGSHPEDFRSSLVQKVRAAKGSGVDGFIVSGEEIALLRSEFPDVTLVSPGIRPEWATADDHKRSCTPAKAIELGADYIVVGRPIRNAGDRAARRDAAKRILEEL